MSIQKFLLTSALYLALAAPDAALAAPAGEGKGSGAAAEAGDDRYLKLRFTEREQAAISRHQQQQKPAAGKQKPLPPGLEKKVARGGELPPGWRKKLARGEVLPPEVRAAGRPLPEDLRRQLPPDPPGTVTLEIDGEVARVVRDTGRIIDILRGH